MAKNKGSAAKSITKSETFTQIASATGLSRKQVSTVFDELTKIIHHEVGKKGPGIFTLPGLAKIKREHKAATKGGQRPNPFKPGEMMEVKPKPARNVVKVRPLKALKEMVK
ncbi:DNA-binding protein [Planctomycetaceae bacterium SCGC AG-212-F19]|nr:DNA-binding protein [Planctomycetaceae bacterium SCGC AG-212-F19]